MSKMITKFNHYNESLRDKMTPVSDDKVKDMILNKDINSISDILYMVYKNDPPIDIINKIAEQFNIPKFNKKTTMDIIHALVSIKNRNDSKIKIENRASYIKPHELSSIDNKYTYITRIHIGEGYLGTSVWVDIRVLPEEEIKLYEYLNKLENYNFKTNESLRDKMVPVDEDSINDILSKTSVNNVKGIICLNKIDRKTINPYIIGKNKIYGEKDAKEFVNDVFGIVYWDSIFTSLDKSEFIQDKYILNRLAEGFMVESPGDVAKDIKKYLNEKGHKIK